MLKALEVFAFGKSNGNPGAVGIMELITRNKVPYHLWSVLPYTCWEALSINCGLLHWLRKNDSSPCDQSTVWMVGNSHPPHLNPHTCPRALSQVLQGLCTFGLDSCRVSEQTTFPVQPAEPQHVLHVLQECSRAWEHSLQETSQGVSRAGQVLLLLSAPRAPPAAATHTQSFAQGLWHSLQRWKLRESIISPISFCQWKIEVIVI